MSAAAGAPYKKRKYVSRKSSAKAKKTVTFAKAPSTTSMVMGCHVGRDPFAAAYPRFFKVKLSDALIFCSGAGTVAQADSTSAAVSWMQLGSAFADITGSAGGNAMQFPFSIQCTLNDVYNLGKYTQAWQQFAFLKMEVNISQTCGDSYGGAILPTLYSVVDDNNSATFGSQQEVNQYGAAVQEHTFSAGKTFNRSCAPKPAALYFLNAVTSGYAPPQSKGPTWLDCDFPGTAHYAFKMYCRNFEAQPNSGMALRVQPTVWFACRNPR